MGARLYLSLKHKNGKNDYKMQSLIICTPDEVLFSMIISKKIIWAGNVAHMEKKKPAYRFFLGGGGAEEKDHCE
jgi:hypothetical protein